MLAQGGQLLESQSLNSKILNRVVEYSIYLPQDYQSSSRKYPVLYLLHGYTDDETGWTQFGEVKKIADESMAEVDVTDMIIAMPDGGLHWYVNSHDGKTRYEDFFIEEFIPYIESTYKARASSEFRAVAGLSMGGHGTLLYAMKHPEMFTAAAPLSAAAWGAKDVTASKQEDWDRYFGFIFGEGLEGEERLTAHVKDNLALYLVESQDPEQLKKVKWYIDCGDDDFLINGNMELHRIMTEKEIPHEFRVRDGAHNWTYWRTALPEVNKFISKSFHR
jgi:S-formylglutathione hydrolase FrmB